MKEKDVMKVCDKCGYAMTSTVWFWQKIQRPIHTGCGGQYRSVVTKIGA